MLQLATIGPEWETSPVFWLKKQLGGKLEPRVLCGSKLCVMLEAHVLFVPKTYGPARRSITPSCWAHSGFGHGRTVAPEMLSPHSSCWSSLVMGNNLLGRVPGVWQGWELLATHLGPIFTYFLSSWQFKHQGFKIIPESPSPTSLGSPLDHLLQINYNILPWVGNNYLCFRNGILRYRKTRVMNPHSKVNI